MKNKEVLLISVTIFLTVLCWISAEIYHIINTEKIKIISPALVKPITISIDEKIFTEIENKK